MGRLIEGKFGAPEEGDDDSSRESPEDTGGSAEGIETLLGDDVLEKGERMAEYIAYLHGFSPTHESVQAAREFWRGSSDEELVEALMNSDEDAWSRYPARYQELGFEILQRLGR